MKQFTISVPASTANIGPGFDSAGMALNRYLTMQGMKQGKWEIEQTSRFLPSFSECGDHFIYKAAEKTALKHGEPLPPCKLIIDSEIPLARGLGSSASAVLAGIELANQLCNLDLSDGQKLTYATEMEGHPDNVAPVIFGGMVISAITAGDAIRHFQLPDVEIDIVTYIPNVELKTDASRGVLPNHFSRRDAAAASGIGNLMIASLIAGDYEFAGKMMEEDMFHEPYRAALIPDYQLIKQEAKKHGAYGTVISGAGPTMISFVPKGSGESIALQMQKILPDHEVAPLKIDTNGITVTQQAAD